MFLPFTQDNFEYVWQNTTSRRGDLMSSLYNHQTTRSVQSPILRRSFSSTGTRARNSGAAWLRKTSEKEGEGVLRLALMQSVSTETQTITINNSGFTFSSTQATAYKKKSICIAKSMSLFKRWAFGIKKNNTEQKEEQHRSYTFWFPSPFLSHLHRHVLPWFLGCLKYSEKKWILLKCASSLFPYFSKKRWLSISSKCHCVGTKGDRMHHTFFVSTFIFWHLHLENEWMNGKKCAHVGILLPHSCHLFFQFISFFVSFQSLRRHDIGLTLCLASEPQWWSWNEMWCLLHQIAFSFTTKESKEWTHWIAAAEETLISEEHVRNAWCTVEKPEKGVEFKVFFFKKRKKITCMRKQTQSA